MAAPAARGSLCQLAQTPSNGPLTPPWLMLVPMAGTVPLPVLNGTTRTVVPSMRTVPPVPEKPTVSSDPNAAEWLAHWYESVSILSVDSALMV